MILEELDPTQLSDGQRELAEYFVRNATRIPYLSIEEVAADVGTSAATVSRFARTAGYASFKELKGAFRDEVGPTPHGKLRDKLTRIGDQNLYRGLLEQEIEHLASSIQLLDQNAFDRAVAALAASEVVCIYGNGSSASLAHLLGFRLNRFGLHVHHLGRDPSSMAEALVHLGPRAVVFAFAFLKERRELERVFAVCNESNGTSVLVTDLRVSRTAEAADIVLQVDRGDLNEFHSMVVPVAIVDAIVLALARRDGGAAHDHLERLHRIKTRIRDS